ncbi:hypothetical protein P2318_00480 [Myxococcaceae bacterium GXIMD 01537]
MRQPGRALALLCLLGATPAAWARESAHPLDAPLRDEAPGRLLADSTSGPATPKSDAAERNNSSGDSLMPGMSGVPPPAKPQPPLSAAAWAAHGMLALAPVGGVYGASLLGDESFGAAAAEAGAGMVAGYFPSRLLFLRVSPGGREEELEVAAFATGLVLTPPLTALGTWGLGEVAFDGSQNQGNAFLGALAGAAAGALVGVVMFELLDHVSGGSKQLGSLRRWVGLGFIGAGATVGYQWAGGGPRDNPSH